MMETGNHDTEEFIECGCCCAYHKKDYNGDCRNDAEHIVKCVNAHDALVGACKYALGIFESMPDKLLKEFEDTVLDELVDIEQLKSALKLAGEGE